MYYSVSGIHSQQIYDGLRSLLAHQNIDDRLMEVVCCFMQTIPNYCLHRSSSYKFANTELECAIYWEDVVIRILVAFY